MLDQLRGKGEMSDADLKLGEDLYFRRANFKMDQYVKLCEVREVVSTALHSILDRMRKADEIARKNRTDLTVVDAKLKTQQ